MRYKILSIFIMFGLICVGVNVDNYYHKELTQVYHQHLSDNSSEYNCKDMQNCSHLPLINLEIGKEKVPYKHKNGSLPEKEKDYLIANVQVFDDKNDVNTLNDESKDALARIRYRGRTSLNFDKKGYSLKFVNKKDEKIDKKFLGMPSDSDWALHGPFIDKTLIRNYIWYNISQEIMGNAPKCRLTELYINKKYQGVYLAVETPTQNEKSRIKISSINKKSDNSSYIIKLDEDLGNSSTHFNSFLSYTHKTIKPLYLTITYPLEGDLTSDRIKYIYDDFGKFEKALYSFDYKTYSKYIDVDNFVDYFIINEFTQNYDAGYLSTYIYKDIFGKLKMYVWDFNSANNNYDKDFLKPGTQDYNLIHAPFYIMLTRDPHFTDLIINRYKELRKGVLSDEYINDYIDKSVEYLGPAIERNNRKWGFKIDEKRNKFVPNYIPKNYEDAIDHLKKSINERARWMDKNIHILKKYSHESINKKFNK